ncbi:hypothetical protein CANCADRAFT_712 [Tortispora caseinolytica NRRL Y-17796]|uniref:SEC7 domain-containing protein n=1 Tax=Tortispora caseinolytica NRRL Y-17796 TaxID=767744 RepID=A0A1E4TK46_9ASCO|nr:hypothetical protein CANCADRAFT_712 [Tortispora caseinolytica NRRL Y-17796]
MPHRSVSSAEMLQREAQFPIANRNRSNSSVESNSTSSFRRPNFNRSKSSEESIYASSKLLSSSRNSKSSKSLKSLLKWNRSGSVERNNSTIDSDHPSYSQMHSNSTETSISSLQRSTLYENDTDHNDYTGNTPYRDSLTEDSLNAADNSVRHQSYIFRLKHRTTSFLLGQKTSNSSSRNSRVQDSPSSSSTHSRDLEDLADDPLSLASLGRSYSSHDMKRIPTETKLNQKQASRARSSTVSSVEHRSFRSSSSPSSKHRDSSQSGRTNTAKSSVIRSSFSFDKVTSLANPFQKFSSSPFTPSSPRRAFTLETPDIPSPDPPLPDESEMDFLIRLQTTYGQSIVPAVLSRSSDTFYFHCLHLSFAAIDLYDYPLDMALRKLLLCYQLPNETQHIDRFLLAFSNRYHEENPRLFENSDQVHFMVFSLLILHTDFFNANNKNKMSKSEFLKNSAQPYISNDLLRYFYDNITFAPFIRLPIDKEVLCEPLSSEQLCAAMEKLRSLYSGVPKISREQIQPYMAILTGDFELYRPKLFDQAAIRECPYASVRDYNFLLDADQLDKLFHNGYSLQVISPLSHAGKSSKDDQFAASSTVQSGAFITILKIGVLKRRENRRISSNKSHMKDVGVILTSSNLYIYKDTSWVKGLIQQMAEEPEVKENIPIKSSASSTALRVDTQVGKRPATRVLYPPITRMGSDESTDLNNIAALVPKGDKSSHTFIVTGKSGVDGEFEVAHSDELEQWVTCINYAAFSRTIGAQMETLLQREKSGGRPRSTSLTVKKSHEDMCASEIGTQVESHMIKTDAGTSSTFIDFAVEARNVDRNKKILEVKMKECELQLKEQEKLQRHYERQANQLQTAAPLQGRTRSALVAASTKLKAAIDWAWLDYARNRVYVETGEAIRKCEREEPEAFERELDILTPQSGSRIFDSLN